MSLTKRATPFARSRISAAVSAVVLTSSLSTNVLGDDSASFTLEEVTVTATKRAESVMDVPLAVTAMTGDFVADTNLNDVKDLVAFTPGVTGNSQDSFIDAISVRGIRTQDFGVGGDPSSAFFKNDLYEGRNGSAVTSLYDMDRVEVLRGPQGFLFGRSAIGGAFSAHTTRAQIDSTDGYIDLDVAERGHVVAEGAINIPISDTFAMRFAGYTSQEDGFVENGSSSDDLIEHDKKAIRWSTTTETENLSVYTTVEYETREQSGSVYRAIEEGDIWDTLEAAIGPINLDAGSEDVDSDQSAGDSDDADILTLGVRVDYDMDFATLTSTTGYKDHDYYYNEDYDGTPLNINNYRQDQKGDYFQQEFRLTSNSSGPLSWYAGVSYYKENIDTEFTFTSGEDFMCQYYGYYYNSGMTFSGCADLYAYYGSPFTASPDGNLTETGRIKGEYSGWGAYVNVDYEVTDTVDVGFGLRYTKDEKDFTMNVPTPTSDLGAYWAWGFDTNGDINASETWSDVTPRVQVRWRPTDESMIFASYTEGFKSGGFGSFSSVSDGNGGLMPNAFDEETIDSIEIGYKSGLMDGRANLEVTAFSYEYKDLQILNFDGGAAKVENLGEVDAYGVEVSFTMALNENFRIMTSLGWLDSEASDLEKVCDGPTPTSCEGTSLFWAPDTSAAMVLNGDFPMDGGEIRSSLEASYESERGGGWGDLDSTKIDAYVDVALRVGYHSNDNWQVTAYVENLTNEFVWDGQNNNGGIIPSHFFGPKRPRTFGVRVGYEWE
ncbi:MAG: TonB-dependent receptor [Cellvibrionaceae bacterium]